LLRGPTAAAASQGLGSSLRGWPCGPSAPWLRSC
jgi:hypothetical protein